MEEIIRMANLLPILGRRVIWKRPEFTTGELGYSERQPIPKKEWREANLKCSKQNSVFYTDYALENWQGEKD